MVGNLTQKNRKCQMPGGEPGRGMGTLGFDSYIRENSEAKITSKLPLF